MLCDTKGLLLLLLLLLKEAAAGCVAGRCCNGTAPLAAVLAVLLVLEPLAAEVLLLVLWSSPCIIRR